MLHCRTTLLTVLLLLLASTARAADRDLAASAPRPCLGLVLITRGEMVKKVGELPADKAAIIEKMAGHKPTVGYKYSHLGIYWLALWTWDGEYVVFHDNMDFDFTEEQISALLGKEVDELGKPWQYRFPPALVLAIAVVALLVLSGRAESEGEAEAKRIAALFEDPRYERALEIIQEEADQSEDAGLSRAVNHLMSQGIPQAEAELNLAAMLQVIAEHGEGEEGLGDEAGDGR